jgi:hypothetical protein
MWIVMSSSAKMPSRIKAHYRNIALVELTEEYAAANQLPKMISTHARGVKSVRHLGHYHVGRTPRGAFQKAFYAAESEAAALNASAKEYEKCIAKRQPSIPISTRLLKR